MASNLAYVPIEQVKASKVTAPKQIDKPDYADVGVAYTGYSKKLQSGQDYILNYQEQVDISTTGVSTAGGEDWFVMHRANEATKDFYCTDIIFSNCWNVVLFVYPSTIEICDDATVRVRLMEDRNNEVQNWVLHFEVPIKFSKGKGIYTHFTVPRTISDRFDLNLYGWEE